MMLLQEIIFCILVFQVFPTGEDLDGVLIKLKDHLGNVRVAIVGMKLPENEATSTRGVPPFATDEKAVNEYKK